LFGVFLLFRKDELKKGTQEILESKNLNVHFSLFEVTTVKQIGIFKLSLWMEQLRNSCLRFSVNAFLLSCLGQFVQLIQYDRCLKILWRLILQSVRHHISGVSATFLAFDTTFLVSQFGPSVKKNLNISRLWKNLKYNLRTWSRCSQRKVLEQICKICCTSWKWN
jgi:hypothetical protein